MTLGLVIKDFFFGTDLEHQMSSDPTLRRKEMKFHRRSQHKKNLQVKIVFNTIVEYLKSNMKVLQEKKQSIYKKVHRLLRKWYKRKQAADDSFESLFQMSNFSKKILFD